MKKVNLEEELNKPIEEPKVVEQPKEVEKPKVEEPIKLSKRAYEAAVALDDALKAFKTAEVEYTSEDVRSLAISFLISANKGTYSPTTTTTKTTAEATGQPKKENKYSIDTGKLDPHGDGNLFKIPDEKYTNPKLPEYRSATGKSAYWRTKRPNNYSCKFDGANGGFYDLVNGELVKV